jgi:peptidoglycan/xylan/chitin deacetylase (PgdA/CDA1 family)
LRDAGWEIGSHTVQHPFLTKSNRARQEIFESKKILEEKLGKPVTVFAYPFGDYNEKIEHLVKEAGYVSARTFSGSKVANGSLTRENRFHMPVNSVWGNMDMKVFLRK